MQLRNSGSLSGAPLRVARSAEVLTPTARRKFFYDGGHRDSCDKSSSLRRKSETNCSGERPKFHLVIENSPSPPEVHKTPRMSRTERPLTRDHSSPELCSARPHSMYMERPHSEMYCTPRTLSIPAPDYMRQTSDPNTSRGSSPGSRTASRTGSTSPRMMSSIQRPLNFNRATPEGENEWQKDRWRHWDTVTSQKPSEGTFEQETLV